MNRWKFPLPDRTEYHVEYRVCYHYLRPVDKTRPIPIAHKRSLPRSEQGQLLRLALMDETEKEKDRLEREVGRITRAHAASLQNQEERVAELKFELSVRLCV